MAENPLARELAKPSFTAGVRHVPQLIELLIDGDDAIASRARGALVGVPAAARPALIHQLAAATTDSQRARVIGALGDLGRVGDRAAVDALIGALADHAPRARRAAINALGKVAASERDLACGPLVARWDASDVTADERRALVEALGKLGGEAALARLRSLAPGDDRELARRRDRALLVADRDARRGAPSAVRSDRAPPEPVKFELTCRHGFAPLLAEERAARGLAGELLDQPLARLFRSRLWVAVNFPLATVRDPAAMTAAIIRPDVRALLTAWTAGPIRWRLGFASGHRRAVVWQVARDVTAAAPELINDPTESTWEFIVDGADRLVLTPKRLADPRFSWRVADVPAASHPTVAAALAFVAEARSIDRVWDPFCGSGGELIERGLLGPFDRLIGSDVDPVALDAARANFAAAGLAATVIQADARRAGPPHSVDLIITNPPLGSRVQIDAARLLCEALPVWAPQLAAGGRLVWITPAPRRTTPVAEALGLRRTRAHAVDLGGVRGQLERWER